MIVQCAACQTRFKIADEKVSDRGVKVRCSKCSTTFVVRKDQAVSELPPGVRVQTVLPLQSELPPSSPMPRLPTGWSEPAAAPPPAPDLFASDLTLKVPDPFAAAARDLSPSLPAVSTASPGWGLGDPFALSAAPNPAGGPEPSLSPSTSMASSPFASVAPGLADHGPPVVTPRTADAEGLNSSIFATAPALGAPAELVLPAVVSPAAEPPPPELRTGAHPLDLAQFGGTRPPAPRIGTNAVLGSISLNTKAVRVSNGAPPSPAGEARPARRKRGSQNAPGPAVSAEAIATARAVMRAQRARRNKRRNPIARVVRTSLVAVLGILLLALAYALHGEPAPTAPGLTVGGMSTGLYDTRAGRPVLYVRGTVVNRSARSGPMSVSVELRRGATVSRTARTVAGALPTEEEIYAVDSPAALSGLLAALEARARPVQAGATAPFLAVFYEYPDDFASLDLHALPALAPATAKAAKVLELGPAAGASAAPAAPVQGGDLRPDFSSSRAAGSKAASAR